MQIELFIFFLTHSWQSVFPSSHCTSFGKCLQVSQYNVSSSRSTMFHPVTEGDALYLEFIYQEKDLRLKRNLQYHLPVIYQTLHMSQKTQIQFLDVQVSCSVISSLLFNLSVPQFFHPGKQGLYYLSLLEFRLQLLIENIYVPVICETQLWKTQKINTIIVSHFCYTCHSEIHSRTQQESLSK